MSSQRFIIPVTCGAILATLISPVHANAAQISTSTGRWISGQLEEPGSPAGIGSNAISWGTSNTPGGQPSSYRFDGRNDFTLPQDGTATSLGVFSHNNFVLTFASNDLASATLAVDLTGDINKTFTFLFNHLETTNNPPGTNNCEAGGVEPCPDLVSLSSFLSTESVNINGQDLLLEILGFQQEGVTTTSFLTLEDQSNEALLMARLTPTTTAVPTPALLPGLLGFGMSILRKRKQ